MKSFIKLILVLSVISLAQTANAGRLMGGGAAPAAAPAGTSGLSSTYWITWSETDVWSRVYVQNYDWAAQDQGNPSAPGNYNGYQYIMNVIIPAHFGDNSVPGSMNGNRCLSIDGLNQQKLDLGVWSSCMSYFVQSEMPAYYAPKGIEFYRTPKYAACNLSPSDTVVTAYREAYNTDTTNIIQSAYNACVTYGRAYDAQYYTLPYTSAKYASFNATWDNAVQTAKTTLSNYPWSNGGTLQNFMDLKASATNYCNTISQKITDYTDIIFPLSATYTQTMKDQDIQNFRNDPGVQSVNSSSCMQTAWTNFLNNYYTNININANWLTTAVTNCISNDCFRAVYQPILDNASGAAVKTGIAAAKDNLLTNVNSMLSTYVNASTNASIKTPANAPSFYGYSVTFTGETKPLAISDLQNNGAALRDGIWTQCAQFNDPTNPKYPTNLTTSAARDKLISDLNACLAPLVTNLQTKATAVMKNAETLQATQTTCDAITSKFTADNKIDPSVTGSPVFQNFVDKTNNFSVKDITTTGPTSKCMTQVWTTCNAAVKTPADSANLSSCISKHKFFDNAKEVLRNAKAAANDARTATPTNTPAAAAAPVVAKPATAAPVPPAPKKKVGG